MTDVRYSRIGLALVVATVPSLAHANLPHIGDGGIALLVAVGLLVVLALPLFAALTAREGHRFASFVIVLALWLALGYAAIRLPTGHDGSEDDAIVAIRLVSAGIGLLVLVFGYRIYRWWRHEPAVDRQD